jgi:hypothetical protein
VKILPMLRARVPLVTGDGTAFDVVPLQVFRFKDGRWLLRYGRNTLWFEPDGTFDGTEHLTQARIDGDALQAALADSPHSEGEAPAESYFDPEAPGYQAETAAWPKPQGGN